MVILVAGFKYLLLFSIINIWDVIRQPLTNSIIFQDGYCTTNQWINLG